MDCVAACHDVHKKVNICGLCFVHVTVKLDECPVVCPLTIILLCISLFSGFANMIVAINTDYYSAMTQAFDSYPRVMACKYMVTFPDNVTQKPLR